MEHLAKWLAQERLERTKNQNHDSVMADEQIIIKISDAEMYFTQPDEEVGLVQFDPEWNEIERKGQK